MLLHPGRARTLPCHCLLCWQGLQLKGTWLGRLDRVPFHFVPLQLPIDDALLFQPGLELRESAHISIGPVLTPGQKEWILMAQGEGLLGQDVHMLVCRNDEHILRIVRELHQGLVQVLLLLVQRGQGQWIGSKGCFCIALGALLPALHRHVLCERHSRRVELLVVVCRQLLEGFCKPGEGQLLQHSGSKCQ